MSTGPHDPLGSAADEARRLVDALRTWAGEHNLGDLPVATGSAECKLCPLCVVLGSLRERQPEVLDYLETAADALISAMRTLITQQESDWASRGKPDVEHIDIQ
jgi:hypothetical protein